MKSRLIRIRISMVSILIVAFACLPVEAVVIDDVADDFKPLSGYIIMETGGEYIVDLDPSKGILSGDLFSVVKPGKKIIHPVSGKILGTLMEVKGVLKVTRLEKGYSYARVLGKAKGIKRGDPIRRYENIPAMFWDYTGKGEPFFLQLRDTLPKLEWQDYAAAQAVKPKVPAASGVEGPTVLFILNKTGLEVRDSEFQIIHAYGSSKLLPAAAAPVAMMPYAAEKSKGKTDKKIGYTAAYPGFQSLGELPGAIVMADFTRDGDGMLMATTDGSSVHIHRIDQSVSTLFGDRLKGFEQVLSVQWWRPSDELPLHLAVTAMKDQKVEGKIFALQENRLVPLRAWLPYFLGTFDLDGDGAPETLLRQSFDPDLFWGGQIKQFNLIKGKLVASKPKFKLPGNFLVLGSLFADLTGDGHLESIFVRNKALYIYDGKKQLYRSPPDIGGSLSVATYEVNPDAKDLMINSAMVEVSPAAADLDGDGRLEVIAIASDRAFVTAPGISPNIRNTKLATVKLRNSMFVKGTLGENIGTPIQGLTVARGQLLFVATESGSVFGKGGKSHLLAYPLAR
jgi:hypothetical protein